MSKFVPLPYKCAAPPPTNPFSSATFFGIASFPCSLIVTGIARDETLGRLLLGTTVEKLARQARQPVLVVKTRPRKPYHDVLVATDFSPGSRQALRAALQLVPDANLTLFHAYDVPFQGKNVLFVSGLNIDVSPREGFPFPFTKFVPWAAYARLRDGRSFLLEQEQLAETLRGMPGDNPDCLSFDGTIEQMTAAPEIRIPIG